MLTIYTRIVIHPSVAPSPVADIVRAMPNQSIASFDAESLYRRGYAFGFNEYDEQSSAETSLWSYSTNATTDNMPGTGRVLESLLRYFGRKADRFLWKSLMKMGCGVDAVKLRLKRHVEEFMGPNRSVWIPYSVIKESNFELIKRDCKKVITYARSV